MTILSKKKVAPAKADQENAEPSNNPTAGTSQQQNSEQHYSPGQLSPGHRWSPHRQDDFNSEQTHENSNRKRHRASPHRVVRTKRERNQSSPPLVNPGSPGAAALNPVPDPSGGPADPSGYNSGDEYNMDNAEEMTENLWLEKDRMFMKKMQKRGFEIKEMGRDGACLFRAVADQVYGDQEMHSVVRKHCMDYVEAGTMARRNLVGTVKEQTVPSRHGSCSPVERNKDHFSQYVTEDFSMYVDRKRKASVHGNHIELQALCEMYNRPVQVFCYKTEPINIFHNDKPNENANNNEPIRLSYERGSHYNSIVDPHKASIGVGLGLPNFKPGLADQNLMADALMQSDNFEIEQAMLQDKIFASDLEATNIAIEEQVARASYLEWVRETEKRSKTKHASSTATSTVTSSSPRSRSHGGSPVPDMRNSPRSSPKAGPSSSSDYFLHQFDSSTPGTSSSQYYFEGPSTSSFQGESSQELFRNSAGTQRNPADSTQSSPKSSAELRTRLHQFGLGSKNPEMKLSFVNLTDKEVGHLVKRFVNSRNTPSSSPGSSTD